MKMKMKIGSVRLLCMNRIVIVRIHYLIFTTCGSQCLMLFYGIVLY